MEPQGASIEDYLAVLRRRWLLLVVPVVLGAIVATLIASALPERFRATARILIESQTIPSELARTTVTSGAVERLRIIEQRLMTRPILLDIAARFGVFQNRAMTPNQIVEAMREATTFQNVALATVGRNQVTASAIDISFQADRAAVAARVANEFVTRLLEENLRARGESASETLAFFTSEATRLGTELAAVEERIQTYKVQNEDALPESVDFRRNELLVLQSRTLERERRRIVLASERENIEAAMRTGFGGGVALSPQEQELQRLRQTLEQNKAIYAPSHPSIRTLQTRIASLEAAIASSGRTGAATGEAAAAGARSELQRRLDAIDREYAVLAEQDARDTQRAQALEASIQRTPEVEGALAVLQRQQQNLQAQYREAVLKRSQAETGERLEVSRASERFEVVEEAQTPQRPEWPNRPLIVAAGAAGGGALGFMMMVLIELMYQRVRTPRDLERLFGLRPIVSVPYIRTERERRLHMLASRATVVALLVLTPAAAYMVDRYVRPLPLIAKSIGDRLGIGLLTGGPATGG
jgi:polysaccharide chain length determinant protein (PEP-CTERM system associated)